MAALSPDPGAATAPRSSRWPTPTEIFAAGGAGALVLAGCLSPDHIEDGPVICPFRAVTGLPCPGCGLTRAWVYLVHGRAGDSFAANPFGAVLIAAVVALGIAVVIARVRRRPAPDLDRLIGNRWVKAVVVAWLVFAVVRLVVVAST